MTGSAQNGDETRLLGGTVQLILALRFGVHPKEFARWAAGDVALVTAEILRESP